MFTTRVLNYLVAARRRHRTTIALAELSDHQLRDIGVSRYDLFNPGTDR